MLRAFWDRARTRTKLRLLLCGSAVRSMEAMRQERAPLYGRLDLALLIHPFKPHEAALMLPEMRPADQAVVYGLLGGVPLYLSWWDQHEPVISNVGRLLGRPGAPLLSEGLLILATKTEAGDLPGTVLRAIATGRTKYNEIKDAVRAEPHRTLERLQELRPVERVLPVGESPERSRRHLYRVAGRLGPRVVEVGRWWQDSGPELDAVVLQGREHAPTLVGEAKWARAVDGQAALQDLRRGATAMVGAGRLDDLRFAIAARERVTHVPAGVLPITASDVFSQAL